MSRWAWRTVSFKQKCPSSSSGRHWFSIYLNYLPLTARQRAAPARTYRSVQAGKQPCNVGQSGNWKTLPLRCASSEGQEESPWPTSNCELQFAVQEHNTEQRAIGSGHKLKHSRSSLSPWARPCPVGRAWRRATNTLLLPAMPSFP